MASRSERPVQHAPDAGVLSDAGFSLIEVLVASMLTGIVMTALTSFFVTTVSITSQQSGMQTAVQLAEEATERVRALKGSGVAVGRDKTSSDLQWTSPVVGVAPYLADMRETWDATATYPAGASAALPTTPKSITVNGLSYGQSWYVGKCWQPQTGGTCGATQTAGYVELFRVVVAVTWPDKHCRTASTCSYVTSTLVCSASGDPLFNANLTAQPPRVTNPGDQTGEVAVAANVQLLATGGAPPLTWSASGLPPGLSVSSDGLISGLPSTAGTYAVIARATDGFSLVGSAAFTWVISPLPVLTSPGAQTTASGTAVSLPIVASGGTAPLAWSVTKPGAWGSTGLPPGLSIDPATGVISGTPTTTGSASNVVVTVTDSYGKSASTTFTWTITDASYRALVVSDSPRAYWRLGESSGTTAVDEMGASNGTYADGYTLGVPGALVNDPNTAVELNGSSGRVSAPSVAALDLTSRVSIEAWVSPDSLAGTRWIVNKGSFYFLYIDSGVTYFGVNAGGSYLYVTTTLVTAGTWQHLVGTYDGTKLVLYRNGAVVAQASASGSITSTTAPLVIGAFDATGAFFDGRIDEVAVYGSALTPAQVLTHFQRGNRTRPDLAVTFPAAGGVYNNTTWNAGCASSICGTAADTGGGVATVTVSIRQGSGNYWNGTAFASTTEVLLAATGTTNWTRAFTATNFPTEGTYTIRAVATDTATNTATTSTTFTIDRTAPAPSSVVLYNANGSVTPGTDEVRITYSELLDTSSICSAWSGTGDQTLGGSGVVVSIPNTGSNDSLTVTAGACTLHIGTIATGRNYVSANSTFSGSTTATESRVTWTASTRLLTIHIGQQTSGTIRTGIATGTVVYTPNAAITDAAGNAIVTTSFSATGQRF